MSHRPSLPVVAAVVACACLMLALVAPRPQPALAAATHTGEAPTAAQVRALIAAEHLRPTTLSPPDGESDYLICLRNADTHCGSYFDVANTVEATSAAITAIAIIYRVITSRNGDSTDQSEGTENDNDSTNGLCLAAAANASDGNDQAYYTSNCFGNKYASWYCVEVDKNTACNYYSVNSLDLNRAYMLTNLDLRNGAYMYVKPATSGTWQKWSWYRYSS